MRQKVVYLLFLGHFLSSATNPSSSYERLMVVGGWPFSEYEVEVIDLSGNHQHCRHLQNGPSEKYGVGTFIGGHAIVCNSFEYPYPTGECFIYNDRDDSWSEGPSTGIAAYASSGAMINNNNNNNNNNGDDEQHWHWWVSGGSLSISGSDLYDETSLTSSSESVLFDGNSFKPFESLTQNNQFHHVIAINETHVVYLEGDSDKTAALLDLTTKTWSNFALFPNEDKDWYYAGLATYPDGSRHLVAAGGWYVLDTSTWIFDLDSSSHFWRPGPKFNFQRGASVQFRGTFLAVGGEQNVPPFEDSDQIWEFNADAGDEKWILRQERLKSSKYHMAAFLVPDDYATCLY